MTSRALGYLGTRRGGRLVLVVGCAVVLTACGSRVPTADIVKAEGGGAVTTVLGTPSPGTQGTVVGGTSGGAVTGGAGPVASGAAGPGTTTGGGTAVGSSGGGTTGGATGGGATGGGTTGGATTGGGTTCTKAGPTILLGQVVSASGIIGANVGSAIPALQAWAKAMNAQGGIACHPVQVFAKDDASDPGKSSSAVQDLVQNKKVVSLVGAYVPLSISGFRSAVDKEKIPVIGGDLFSVDWWESPYFYPVGTYVNANAFGSSQALAAAGATKVAVIYCLEAAVCPPYKDAVVQNAAKGGYQVVYNTQVSITTPSFTSQCQSAQSAGATQINMILEGGGVARFANSCAQIGYYPKFAVASLGATFDIGNAAVQKMSVTIASAANDWFTRTTKGQVAFQDAMKRYAPNQKLDPTAILAWSNGMMVKKAIEKLGASAVGVPITTAMVRKGLAMVQNETLDGLIASNSFSPTMGPNPKNMCYFTDQFRAPGQWHRLSIGCLK
jgi:ABC-type branched-subunit amino acid transport system substrate-binding protein